MNKNFRPRRMNTRGSFLCHLLLNFLPQIIAKHTYNKLPVKEKSEKAATATECSEVCVQGLFKYSSMYVYLDIYFIYQFLKQPKEIDTIVSIV